MASILLFLILTILTFWLQKSKPKQKLFKVVFFLCINVFIIELFCYGYLLFLVAKGGNFYLIGNQKFLDKVIKLYLTEIIHADRAYKLSNFRVDPQLGYTVVENRVVHDQPTTNSHGMRATRDYSYIPPPNKLRIAAIGDSFVFCDGEFTQNTWTHILERSLQNIEVLNFGVSGYGLGQSIMRYKKDGILFKPDIIYVNYMEWTKRDELRTDDILRGRSLRNADIYATHFWLGEDGQVKSQAMSPFDLFDRKFRENVVYRSQGIDPKAIPWSNTMFRFFNTTVLIRQAYLQKYLPKKFKKLKRNTEAIHQKLLEEFFQLAIQNKSSVVIGYGKDRSELPLYIQKLLDKYSQSVLYFKFHQAFYDRLAYYGLTREKVLNHTNHYNAEGNRVYAETIASVLGNFEWGSGDRKFRYDLEVQGYVKVKE